MRTPKVRHWRQPWRSIRSGGPSCMLEADACAVQGPGGTDKSVIPMQALLSCRDRALGIVAGALLLGGLVIARISGWQTGLQAPFSFRRASGMVSAATPVLHAFSSLYYRVV